MTKTKEILIRDPSPQLPEPPSAIPARYEHTGHIVYLQVYGNDHQDREVAGWCVACIELSETLRYVAVLTNDSRLQSLLELGLATGNNVLFRGTRPSEPPTPGSYVWSTEVYITDQVLVRNHA